MLPWPALLVLLLQNVDADAVPGVVTISSNPSGVQCGQVRCLTEAYCTNRNKCECPARMEGDGEFDCYQRNDLHTEISDSPLKLTTFKDATGEVYWPCKFRYTEFTTSQRNSRQTCHFQVLGINEMFKGRIAPTGVEVNVGVTSASNVTIGIGIRITGKVENGVFKYTEWGRNYFIVEQPVTSVDTDDSSIEGSGNDDSNDCEDNEWGPPEELNIGGGETIHTKIDEDNFVTISVPSCRMDIRLRAPNVDVTRQSQYPGLAVTISGDNAQADFISPFTYLADTPFNDASGSNDRRKNWQLNQESLHRAMVYSARQACNPQGEECEDTALTYRFYCDSEKRKKMP